LLLDPPAQAELRSRLARRIGSAGVNAQNDALALVCTPTAARGKRVPCAPRPSNT